MMVQWILHAAEMSAASRARPSRDYCAWIKSVTDRQSLDIPRLQDIYLAVNLGSGTVTH
jgi:hypothetical protein